jgi:transcriptional regulator with XRE-family HTH domain
MSDMSAGEWLRNELARRGISVRDATEAVGLKATQAVYAWMSDKAAPTDEPAAKLAALLDVPEIEVRRRFGLWVPGENAAASPRPDLGEFEEQLELVRTVVDGLLARIKLDRADPASPAIRSVDKLDR